MMYPALYPQAYYPSYNTGMQPAWPQSAAALPLPQEVSPSLPQRLINGAQGYFQQVNNQMQSHLSILLPVPAKHTAEATMLAEMLVMGSPATKELISRWSQEGLKIHTVASGDKLMLTVSGPTGQEALMTSAALQLLTRPMMQEGTYHALKEDLVKNLQSSVSNPDYPIMSAVHKTMYAGGHPYSITPSDILNQLQTQQFRQVQQRLGETLQFPEGAVVSMVSSQPVWQQQQAVGQAVLQAGWFASPYRRGTLEKTPPPQIAPGIQGPVYVAEENLQYARIIHSWKAPQVSDPDYPAFCLLKEILGGMNSGFFKVLRTEKGLVYGTQQSYNPYAGAADYSVSAQVDFDKINTTLQAVQQVVHDISTRPVSPAEFEMARKRALLSLRNDKQSTLGVAIANNSRLSLDIQPIHPDAMQMALQRVTPQDLQRVANRVFNPFTGSQVIGVSAPQAVLQQNLRPAKRPSQPSQAGR